MLHCQPMFIKWIREGLAQPGKTQAGLAKSLGVDPSAVSKMLRGERSLHADEIAPAAAYLGSFPPVVGPRRIEAVQTIPVRHVAARGVWRERDTVPFKSLISLPIVPDQRWVGIEQWAAQIDSSQNYVICVTYVIARPVPRHDDLVLVERSRGDLIEHALFHTCWSLDMDWTLRAEDDKSVILRMKDPSVTILGLCIGRYQSFAY